MRRLLPVLLLTGVSLAPHAVPARAQDDAGVELQLVAQTPWNGPRPAERVLEVRLRARNAGSDDIHNLTLVATIHAPTRGRLEYEASLRGDETGEIFAQELLLQGPLQAGGTRELVFRKRLDETPLVERSDTAVYPLKLELRSDDAPVGTVRTPILFVSPQDEVEPLVVSTTVVLAERLHQDAAGVFLDRALEEAVADEGWLARTVAVLGQPDTPGLTLAVSPLLLRQLQAMRGGYRVAGEDPSTVPQSGEPARAAGRVIDDLAEILLRDEIDLAGYPYAAATLPSLAAGGLDEDIARQLDRGAELTEALLGRLPDPALVRPPLGLLDEGSVEQLSERGGPGGPALLLDPGTAIPPEEPLEFAPVATGRTTAGDAPPLSAVLPSAALASLLDSLPEDPTLRARAALGELAVIYLEEPGQPRGLALLVGDDERPESAFLDVLMAGLRAIPFLRPAGATEFLNDLPPEAELPLVERSLPGFSLDYVSAIRSAKSAVDRFRAVFPDATQDAEALSELRLIAEGQQFIRDEPGGRAIVDHISGRVGERLKQVVPPRRGEPFTLASRNTTRGVPVTLRNLTGGRVHVRVALLSSALRFGTQGYQVYDFEGEFETHTFPVQARRGGRFPVDVVVCTPLAERLVECGVDSPEVIATSQIVIRSTQYNRVALVLTVGAAAFLLLGWARRVVRRRRSAA